MSRQLYRRKIIGPLLAMFGNHVFLLLLCCTCALPFVWMILTSFKPFDELDATHWIPHQWQPGNYGDVFKSLDYDYLARDREQTWKL